MIDSTFVVTMAAYNRWQNENLFDCADGLSDADRKLDRGAFFKSIHHTLNHILWADETWMSRFTPSAPPATPHSDSQFLHEDWSTLRAARTKLDDAMETWAASVDPAWLARSSTGRWTRSNGFLVAHMFNHQTHHRGQVHALLTAAGASPSDTDLLKLR